MAQPASFKQTFRRFFEDYLSAVGGRTAFGRLIHKAVGDPKLRAQLVASPSKALADAGVMLPDSVEVEVLENTDKIVHIVLPPLIATDVKGSLPS